MLSTLVSLTHQWDSSGLSSLGLKYLGLLLWTC